jgi:hypothetical protein
MVRIVIFSSKSFSDCREGGKQSADLSDQPLPVFRDFTAFFAVVGDGDGVGVGVGLGFEFVIDSRPVIGGLSRRLGFVGRGKS